MSHEITEREDGTAEAAFALTPAWHGLGTVLDHPMTSQEALETAQLDWRVVQRPVAIGETQWREVQPGWTRQEEYVEWHEQPNHLANVREDNGFLLGLVSEHYKLVQNIEAFGFLDALIEEEQMTYESAFSLKGGKNVVLLGRLPKVDEIVQDDQLARYIALGLTHDGTGAIQFGPITTRIVCANTYKVALGEGTMRELSINHKGDVMGKLKRARTILGMADDRMEQYAKIGRKLADQKFTTEEWERFLDVMCPQLSTDDPDWTERRQNAVQGTRRSIREAYRNERQTLAGIEGSAWSAYNAVVEHIDHLPRRGGNRLRKAEARFNVCLYGVGRDMKQRALESACRIANVEMAV